jgi:hypothetical protein
MTERFELCPHLGEQFTHGRSLNRLSFCGICGESVIRTILDLVAYLKEPRQLRNGKVRKKRLLIGQKINFTLDHIRVMNYHRRRQRGKPPIVENVLCEPDEPWLQWDDDAGVTKRVDPHTRKSLSDYDGQKYGEGNESLFEPVGAPLDSNTGSGRMPGRNYIQEAMYRATATHIYQSQYNAILDLNSRAFANQIILPNIDELLTVLSFLSKVCIQPKKRELDAIYATFLVKSGVTFDVAMKFSGVGSVHTLYSWAAICEQILKKQKSFPNAFQLLPPFRLLTSAELEHNKKQRKERRKKYSAVELELISEKDVDFFPLP